MQKKVLVLILFALFLTPLYPVYAQTAASSPAYFPAGRIQQIAKDKAQNTRENEIEKRQTVKERIASRSALLKEKLAKFKDKRKANLAEKINNILNQINERRTTHFSNVLNKMTEILSRLQEKVNTASTNGKDMTTANAAITDAQNAISSASAAVAVQKDKDYTIEATSEATIKQDAAAARNALHSDLQSVHNLVVQARQATAKAISTTVSTLKGAGNNGT